MNTTILIVDDDRAIVETMREFIRHAGFDTIIAESAEEAIDLLKKEVVHVVITDIMLPGIDGLELTDYVKKNCEAAVIVMTGFSAEYSYEEAIKMGASDFVFKPVRLEELMLRLRKVLQEIQLKVERDQMLAKLQKLAITDDLTALYNSRHFYKELTSEINRSNRYSSNLSLMVLDIDHFKQYNDAYGHLAGNMVLIKLGQIIKSCLRKMDTAYRYGGEEFTIILPETGCKDALHVAERIRETIEKEVFNPDPGTTGSITISIGITQYSHEEEMTTFIQRADKAMYQAKKDGRNRVSTIDACETT
ncbi:MAG: diguanylate cyclase [Desulfobacterales bacterium]|nr:diguanylate cyclase [Desulfobacterales bacterium]